MLDEKIREKYIFYVGRALRLAQKRYKEICELEKKQNMENPPPLSPFYGSVLNQLTFLYDIIVNKKEDEHDIRVKIHTFSMGAISTREFYNDEIFFDRIGHACYIADQIVNGLKPKRLPNDSEENPNYYKTQEKLKKKYPDDYYV